MATRNVPPRSGANSTNSNSSKFANAGAAAGGFVGAMGGSFVPPVNVTVNRTTNKGGGAGQS
ncbi:sporulation protein SsgA, partial [Streptomyces anthocyanicus]